MAIPTHLEHKPIVGVDNYDTMDGKCMHNTDAQALSIGEAQYDNTELSAKSLSASGHRSRRCGHLITG